MTSLLGRGYTNKMKRVTKAQECMVGYYYKWRLGGGGDKKNRYVNGGAYINTPTQSHSKSPW